MNKQRCNRGSEWHKWDLHIHSPMTFLNNLYEGVSVDAFVNKILMSGITAVGLTNYFRFAEGELEEIKRKLNENNIVVFPNLEFRVEPFNTQKEGMHIHILFNNDIDLKKINDFLGRLKTVDDKYCRDLDKQSIGEVCISFDTLKNTLNDDRGISHLKDYILVACPRGQGSFRPSQKDDGRGANIAREVDRFTDILFGADKDREYFLNTDRYLSAVPKPVFYCSDAHQADKIGTNCTWVKADATLEGLRQTLYEPSDRIAIQERNPAESKTKRIVIDQATFVAPSGMQQTVCFSKDLNAIIGVRGSGKSTLLKNLAKNISPQEFKERDAKPPYALKDFKVTWGDNQANDGTAESPKSAFYIPQGYLSALAYDDGDRVKERDKFLTNLLKQNERFKGALQLFDDFASKNKLYIEGLIETLLSAYSSEEENYVLLQKQGSESEILLEIQERKRQLSKHKNTSLTEKEVQQYTETQKVYEANKKEMGILKQDQEVLSTLSKIGADITIAHHDFSLLSAPRQVSIQEALRVKGKENLEHLMDEENALIEKQISKLEQLIINQGKVLEPLEKKIEKSRSLKKLTGELSGLEQTLERIKILKTTLHKSKAIKEVTIDSLVDAYEKFKSKQTEIYQTIRFEERFSFLEIKIITRHNNESLKDFVEKNINTRDSDASIKTDPAIKALFFGGIEAKLSKATLKKLIIGLIHGGIPTKVGANDTGGVFSSLLKNRFEIDYLKSVKTRDSETPFGNMTGGQKAIALLELIFKFDNEKYPILIDQPEDDLDVTGIASDLVGFIKAEKKERQVIVVTHNASLLVCSDAENIIVSKLESSEKDKHTFSYDTGSIENRKRRKDIIEILEGGENALKQRMLKLNIH